MIKQVIQDIKNFKHRFIFNLYRIFKSKKLIPNHKNKNLELIFEDDFKNGFNEKIWSTSPRWGKFHPRSITERNEAPTSYWDKSAVEIKNEKLVLKNIKEDTEVSYFDYQNSIDYGKYTIPYKVGWVSTSNSINVLHGYFEISCRIPKGIGHWPAFWMASNHDWPPEIDQFEFWTDKPWYDIFHKNQRLMKSGFYTGTGAKPNKMKTGILGKSPFNPRNGWIKLPKNITETFNKYGLEWSPKGMKCYFNDVLVWEDGVRSTDETLHKYDMHVILNNGISIKTPINQLSDNMDSFEVDYVKIYKLD